MSIPSSKINIVRGETSGSIEEGSKSVLYEVELMGLEAITLWIMRALDCVEVLEPRKLADEVDRRVGAYLEHKDKGRAR